LAAHEGYVSWEKAETIRKMVNSSVATSCHHGAPKHGDALLAGLLRCRRCGRNLTLRYSGTKHYIHRYGCSRGWLDSGEPHCIAFGCLRVDDAIADAILTVVSPGAVAALQRPSVPRKKPLSNAIKCVKHSKRLAMRPTVPSSNTTSPTLLIG
jgi:Recombinase zinc beta ribbon domain